MSKRWKAYAKLVWQVSRLTEFYVTTLRWCVGMTGRIKPRKLSAPPPHSQTVTTGGGAGSLFTTTGLAFSEHTRHIS